MDFKGSKTQKNLIAAFGAECMARVKYELYGIKARKDGYRQIGNVFDETAHNELAHAEMWMVRLDGLGSTAANLTDAAKGENYEYEQMYKDFAAIADEEGFDELAKLFRKVGKIEKNHRDRYDELAKNIADETVFEKPTEIVWICLNCGYVHKGKTAPATCPVCAHPQAFFQQKCDNY